MYDIIIIGAGTAGLTAAIYAARAGKTVLIFESQIYGGQIVGSLEVENYPGIKKISGADFAQNLYEQAIYFNVKLKSEQVTGIKDDLNTKVVITKNHQYICNAIILATGAKNRLLNIEKETELIGKGISYCATCDGAFFKGKTVAVIGGGNTAFEDALFLNEYCKKVYLIHRRNEFRCEKKLLEALTAKSNVEFILNSIVVSLIGSSHLNSIELENTENNIHTTINIDGLFVAIGQVPQNDIFLPIIKLDDTGYIIAAENCKTNIEGIFCAGDCRAKSVRQLTTAASDGTIAGLASCEYISLNKRP